MFSLSQVLVATCVLTVCLTNVHGLSDEEKTAIKTLIRPFLEECGKEYGVSEADMKAAKETKTIKDLNPCLFACVFKKIGIIDAEGKFDVAKATELAQKFVPAEDEKKVALDIINTCSSVNDQEVSDGDLGCERAKLIVECYLPLKGQFPGAP